LTENSSDKHRKGRRGELRENERSEESRKTGEIKAKQRVNKKTNRKEQKISHL
jgi:hypothetical protein